MERYFSYPPWREKAFICELEEELGYPPGEEAPAMAAWDGSAAWGMEPEEWSLPPQPAAAALRDRLDIIRWLCSWILRSLSNRACMVRFSSN